MIQRYIEEALDLRRMQVDSHYPGDSCTGQQIGNQFGGDRFTAPGLTVLTGIPIKGNHGRDMGGRSAFKRIRHDQQLH